MIAGRIFVALILDPQSVLNYRAVGERGIENSDFCFAVYVLCPNTQLSSRTVGEHLMISTYGPESHAGLHTGHGAFAHLQIDISRFTRERLSNQNPSADFAKN